MDLLVYKTLMQQKKYLRLLKKAIKNGNKNEIEEAYIAYKKFTHDNNLKDEFQYEELVGAKYILDVTLERIYVETESVGLASNRLREAIANNADSLVDGVSLEEADLLLKWVIQNAINAAADDIETISDYALSYNSYFVQSVMVFPFMNAKLPYTINNTKHFAEGVEDHPFITASIPIKLDGRVVMKRYLIDPTYKQYFTANKCNIGVLIDGNVPDPGYFICKAPNGTAFATELLKNGYIELTNANANLYGYGFTATTSFSYESSPEKLGERYIQIMDECQDELVYQADNIDFIGLNCAFPVYEKQKKYEGKKDQTTKE